MDVNYMMLKSGRWGIRGPATFKPGNIVGVTKRNGDVCTETVKAIVYTGDGVCLAEIEPKPPAQKSTDKRAGAGVKMCRECGVSFSRSDARTRGGDFKNSYCGC